MENRISITTPEYIQLEYETAGIGSRALAAAVDGLITYGLPILLFFLAFPFFLGNLIGPRGEAIIFAIFWILLFTIPLAYRILTEYYMKGQTLGKRLMGLRVVLDDGRTPTFFAIFLRNILCYIDILPFGYALGMIVILFNKKEKRIGDLVAGTMVVRERKKEKEALFLDVIPEKEEKFPVDHTTYHKITDEQFFELEKFMARRSQLDPIQRQELARLFVDTLFPEDKINIGEEEAFLEEAFTKLKQSRYLGV